MRPAPFERSGWISVRSWLAFRPGGSPGRAVAGILGAIVLIATIAGVVIVNQLGSQTADEALARLERRADEQAQAVESLISSASRDLRLLRRSAVFDEASLGVTGPLPDSVRRDVEAAIRYVGERYDVDEICLIRANGEETARFDNGAIARPADLSPDESQNNPAFLPTMLLADDTVHVTEPYVSPDSDRWVLGLATPIILPGGRRAGILHFEIPILGLANELTSRPFGSQGYAFIVDRDGRLLVHPEIARFRIAAGLDTDPNTAPFPAATASGSPSWQSLIASMLVGGSGQTILQQDGRAFHVIYRPTAGGRMMVGSVSPDDELFADVARARENLILGVAPLLLLLLVVTGWFAGRLVRTNRELERASRGNARLAAIVQSADDAVLSLSPDGTILTWNEGAAEMYGYEAGEVAGHNVRRLFSPDRRDEVAALIASVARGEPVKHFETLHETEDGRLLDVSLTCSPIRNTAGEVTGSSVVARDISERKRLEDKLAHQALHDALTGLPNRVLFHERLKEALRSASKASRRGTDNHTAVLFVDLDNFKVVNDGLGHAAGDQLLVEVGRRLTECLRAGDTAARFGGDEFTILFNDLASAEAASHAADRILGIMRAPFVIDRREVIVSASIGIAVSATGSERPDDLLRDADLALYEAKSRGKARHDLFDPAMTAAAWRRLELEGQLRRALEEGQLRLHYQPIVELETGRTVEVEALVRWQHPDHGLIPPAEFIPLAEQTGLIGQLGQLVLDAACAQLHEWQAQRADGDRLTMAVNLSPRQFEDPDLVDRFARTLRRHEVDGRDIKLEITESAMLAETDRAAEVLRDLRDLGIRIALDDFGAGHSSLSHLRKLPIDAIKIDRSFVEAIGTEPGQAAIVSAAIALAGALSLEVTAEGIETKDQLETLSRLGCRFGQGFYIARPQDPAAMAPILGVPSASVTRLDGAARVRRTSKGRVA